LAGRADAEQHAATWIALYGQGLAKYRSRDLDGAIVDFEKVLMDQPQDIPAKAMLARCRELLTSKEECWRPVTSLNSK
jgi:adenylate cyclase